MKKFTPGMTRWTAKDILPLARHFLRQVIEDFPDLDFASDVQELLVTRDYPGNIREFPGSTCMR